MMEVEVPFYQEDNAVPLDDLNKPKSKPNTMAGQISYSDAIFTMPRPWSQGRSDKDKLSLDLNPCTMRKKQHLMTAPVLSSPDLNLLKLSSPELERMIIQMNGSVTTTPTPSAAPTGSLLMSPKIVTEEQEQYARGFVEALQQLHHGQVSKVSEATRQPATSVPTVVTSQAVPRYLIPVSVSSNDAFIVTTDPNEVCNLDAVVTSAQLTCLTQPSDISHVNSEQQLTYVTLQPTPATKTVIQTVQIKEEPRTTLPQTQCAAVDSSGSIAANVTPIDMATQEHLKQERKRFRNRLAATKCRKRKLERISTLEEQVDCLKVANQDLATKKYELNSQIALLKQRVLDHVKGGCHMILEKQMSAFTNLKPSYNSSSR